ncbi:unnamed protein product [Rotaria magnacalcarata]|uniref:Reverse transcriptase domain-containing protein n=1 Tax=Rotaria magnacalcarata TaxID=392030 RepID=A0A816SZF7_9BILA|nr:unnamed protein product [Rotaria magnacalcarata]
MVNVNKSKTTIEKERQETFSKKIDEITRTFHAKIGTIKDKQGRDLMEKEDIKKWWREYTEELYKKDTQSIDENDGSTIELEPDILESEIKWALECIANNKTPGIDEIPAELFKILGDDAMKILLPICQQIWKKQGNFKKISNYLCFIDYTKAFDCVDHNELWTILNNMGVPKHIICLLKNLYTDQEATVRTEYGLTEWFKNKKEVRQGCILSPCLFNLYAEYIMRNAELDETEAGIKISGRNINNLRYADDTTFMAENEDDLKTLLMKVKEESAKAGLLLNIKKTKIVSTGTVNMIQIDGEEIEVVPDFIFLGSKIHRDGDCSNEIKRRLLLGRKAMMNLEKILKCRDITLSTKVRIANAMVFPVVTYGCESWTIKKADRRKIDAFELWCRRKLLRTPWAARRTNRSILDVVKPDFSLEALIMKLKLKYFGHIMRRQDSLEKTLMLGKLEGNRKRGRQKIRWLDTITDVMDTNLQELKEMVTDRQAWRNSVYRVTKSRTRLND